MRASISPTRIPSVCLRCQWRHFVLGLQPLKSHSWRLLARYRGAARASYHAGARPTEASSSPASSRRRKSPSFRHHAHSVAYRRLNLNEQSIPLGINVLGEPAEIRVLKDQPATKALDTDLDDEQESALGLEKLLEELQEKKGTSDPSEAFENIEQVRATLNGTANSGPSLAECRSVAQLLFGGFTLRQLQSYVKKPQETIASKESLQHPYTSALYSRTKWFSGASDFPETAVQRLGSLKRLSLDTHPQSSLLLADDISRSNRQRVTLVNKILREVWQVQPHEERHQRGEVDMRVDKDHLEVLLKSNSITLERVSSTNNVQLNVSPTKSLVRITADRAAAGKALAAIEMALNDVKSDLVPVVLIQATNKSGVQAPLSNEEYLQKVEDLTKTAILYTKPKAGESVTTAKVLYFAQSPESIADARRLLRWTLPRSRAPHVGMSPALEPASLQRIPVDVKSTLAIHYRRIIWARLRALPNLDVESSLYKPRNLAHNEPIFSPSEKPSEQRRRISTTLLSAWKGTQPLCKPTEVDADCRIWQPRTQKALSAQIGALVHAPDRLKLLTNPALRKKTYLQQDTPLISSSQGSQVLFDRSGVLKTLGDMVHGQPDVREEIYINLQPESVIGEADISHHDLPLLEIHVGLDQKANTTSPPRIRLTLRRVTFDLMLPKSAADLRLEARALIAPARDNPRAVAEYLHQGNLDIWGSDRLSMPENLDLVVPRFACQASMPRPNKSREQTRRAQAVDLWSPVKVRYRFSHLEHWSSLHMLYQGFPLVYTTIEAGQAGGRRNELRLEADALDLGGSSNREISKYLFDQWYGAARKLVGLMSASGDIDTSEMARNRPQK